MKLKQVHVTNQKVMIWYVFIPTTVMYILQLIFVFLLFLGIVCMLMNVKQTKNKN